MAGDGVDWDQPGTPTTRKQDDGWFRTGLLVLIVTFAIAYALGVFS